MQVASAIDKVGAASSLPMVPKAAPPDGAMVAFMGLLRMTRRDSSVSNNVSPLMVTSMVRVVTPGMK